MDFKSLRTFIAVAEAGSFSEAAHRLCVTQSAVSMHIKAMERDWNVTLFDRTSRPPILTQRGWTLLAEARELLARYEKMKVMAGARLQAMAISVRIGVVPSIATELLPEVMRQLNRDHAGLTVRAESGLSADLQFQVSQGRLDAAVVTGMERIEVGMAVDHIRTEELQLFAHPELMKADVHETIRSSPFIRFSSSINIGRIVDEHLRLQGLGNVNAIAELDSVEAILGMVRLQLGVAILPVSLASRLSGVGLAKSSLSPPVVREVIMVARKENAEQPAVAAIRETFQAVATARR